MKFSHILATATIASPLLIFLSPLLLPYFANKCHGRFFPGVNVVDRLGWNAAKAMQFRRLIAGELRKHW